MTSDEITTQIRRGIREPNPVSVSNTQITAVALRGVLSLGQIIKEVDPSFFLKRAVLQSSYHVFNKPSDCLSIQNVWDTKTNATAITDATNASPVVVTSASHGLSSGDKVLVSGVTGNTAANGMWELSAADTDTATLYGSTGNAAYVSGGYIIELSQEWELCHRINPEEQGNSHRYKWYPLGSQIVLDYLDQSYDIVVDYIYRPSSVTDIPSEYHDGIVAYGVMQLIQIPGPKDPSYADKMGQLEYYRMMWGETAKSIRESLQASNEIVTPRDHFHWDSLWEPM